MSAPSAENYATFESTGLPAHPAIRHAFAELQRLDTKDRFTTRGVKVARLIADKSVTQDPEAIAAGLLVPLASDNGAVLLARADLQGRVPEMIQSLFALGGMTLDDARNGKDAEDFYKSLDPATRSVILASSVRMFDVSAQEMRASSVKDSQNAADYLNGTLQHLRNFAAMVNRAETEETALAAECQASLRRVESAVEAPAAPAAKHKSKPPFTP